MERKDRGPRGWTARSVTEARPLKSIRGPNAALDDDVDEHGHDRVPNPPRRPPSRRLTEDDMKYLEGLTRGAGGASKPPPGVTAGKGFSIVGFVDVKKSAHTLTALQAILAQEIARARRVWRWSPTNLVVQFHRSERVFGWARNPGAGPRNGLTVISLSHRLLQEYDADSVGRTVIHELCHHYRCEKFAVPAGGVPYKGHDDVFCRELGRADTTVAAHPKACRYFGDDRIAPKIDHRVKWSPSLGQVRHVKKRGRGQILFWEPRRAGAWEPVETLLLDTELVALAKRFKSPEWSRVKIVGFNPFHDLESLLRWLSNRHAKLFPKTTELYRHSAAGGLHLPPRGTDPMTAFLVQECQRGYVTLRDLLARARRAGLVGSRQKMDVLVQKIERYLREHPSGKLPGGWRLYTEVPFGRAPYAKTPRGARVGSLRVTKSAAKSHATKHVKKARR